MGPALFFWTPQSWLRCQTELLGWDTLSSATSSSSSSSSFSFTPHGMDSFRFGSISALCSRRVCILATRRFSLLVSACVCVWCMGSAPEMKSQSSCWGYWYEMLPPATFSLVLVLVGDESVSLLTCPAQTLCSFSPFDSRSALCVRRVCAPLPRDGSR